LVAGLPEDSEVTYIDIHHLPLYNQDYDADSRPKGPFLSLLVEYQILIKLFSPNSPFLCMTFYLFMSLNQINS